MAVLLLNEELGRHSDRDGRDNVCCVVLSVSV